MPEKVGGFFTQKLGPLPLWGWAALALVGLLAYWFLKKSGPFAASAPADTSQSYPAAGSLPGMLGAGAGTNLGTIADGGPPAPDWWNNRPAGTPPGGDPHGPPIPLSAPGAHPGVSDELYRWRIKQGYSQSALVALPGATAGTR